MDVIVDQLFLSSSIWLVCFETRPEINDNMNLDWLQSLKQVFINVSYQTLIDSLILMALF